MYPACLIGSWAVALMGIRTRLGLISGQAVEQPFGPPGSGRVYRSVPCIGSVANEIEGYTASSSSLWVSKALPVLNTLQTMRASLLARAVASLLRCIRGAALV